MLRDLKHRGVNEPRLVIGDGALGISAALRDDPQGPLSELARLGARLTI